MIRPIALLTDFNSQDIFVGVLKGVILSINPWASITDLCHGVPPQDIRTGAFNLYCAHAYFPRKTIFCTVVDPGVGSERRAIALETERYFFVGPDNGVLFPAAQADGIRRAVVLDRPEFFLDKVSSTFHGRDIFSPIAAHISLSRDILELGSKIPVEELEALTFPKPETGEYGIQLTVLHQDTYGNLTLNLDRETFEAHCGDGFVLSAGLNTITDVYPAYAHAPAGRPFLLEASNGFMEIAVKNQSAAQALNLGTGSSLILKTSSLLP